MILRLQGGACSYAATSICFTGRGGSLRTGWHPLTKKAQALDPDPHAVQARLAEHYGSPQHGNPQDVFFCAIYVLLSAQTTLEQASAALANLVQRWPTPEALSRASSRDVRRAINSCGFGAQRTPKIRALARAVACRPFDDLEQLADHELESRLTALPGIGFKTARVVAAMSSLRRDRFAIDIHTWRIAKRLGWISRVRLDRKPTLQQADALEQRIPVDIRRTLHANLVALGRDACGPKDTNCGACVLSSLCKQGARSRARGAQLRHSRAEGVDDDSGRE